MAPVAGWPAPVVSIKCGDARLALQVDGNRLAFCNAWSCDYFAVVPGQEVVVLQHLRSTKYIAVGDDLRVGLVDLFEDATPLNSIYDSNGSECFGPRRCCAVQLRHRALQFKGRAPVPGGTCCTRVWRGRAHVKADSPIFIAFTYFQTAVRVSNQICV
jgi:hypothetical protein